MNLSMEARLSIELEIRDNKELIERLSSCVRSLTEKYQKLNSLYAKECERRRIVVIDVLIDIQIFNELQDMKGAIRVFCRIRPLIQQELNRSEESVIEYFPYFPVIFRAMDHSSLHIRLPLTSIDSGKGQRRTEKFYDFDRVFDEGSTQREVFSEMEGLVTSVLDGYSACIFAYGQTGSGKTFTMEGDVDNELLRGVIPRTLEALCSEMKLRSSIHYNIHISMIEIYNEKVYDLLGNNLQVDVRLNADGQVILGSAVSEAVDSLEAMQAVLVRGNNARRVAYTASNEHSSRSHMLFLLTVEAFNETTSQHSSGRLVLVDLAGSERVAKTESTGQHLIEGQFINKSLSSLGDVIHALNNKHKHIPFRNSTLTFVLQDVLTEGNKVLMITQLSPAACNAQESLQSLEFANRVNKVVLGRSSENKTHPMIAKLTDSVMLWCDVDE